MNTEDQNAPVEVQTHRPVVAQQLNPTAPIPESARRVNFLKALLLFWLLPKRFGPHLAAASFRRALSAHLFAAIIAVAVLLPTVLMDVLELDFGALDLQQWRRELAKRIFDWAEESADPS